MYASTSARLTDHAVLSARPRPLAGRCMAPTSGSSYIRRRAICSVPSVLALSTIVICQENGNVADR